MHAVVSRLWICKMKLTSHCRLIELLCKAETYDIRFLYVKIHFY